MTNKIFIGMIPEEIDEELEEKAKAMLAKIYQAGKIFALRAAEGAPGVLVLDTWLGDDHVVFQESMRKISLRQGGQPVGFRDYFIEETHLYCECQAGIAIRAAHLLCEYMFPHEVYTNQDLKKPRNQKTLNFLRDLFPEENFESILERRMDNSAIWNAIVSAGVNDPCDLYEKIAIYPDLVILLREQEQWRSSIEDPSNSGTILRPESVYKLDNKFPASESSTVGMSFFLLCMRRELLKQFDFAGDPKREVVRAAMLLNSTRNGGGAISGFQPLELPEQVRLKLFIIEWEVLVQLLAFLSNLPADDVRSLTQHTVLQRGEEARVRLTQALRQNRLDALKLACKTADYSEVLLPSRGENLPYSVSEMVFAMRHSANYQLCREKRPCKEKCLKLLQKISEHSIWFPKKICTELCEGGHYALLLAIEAISCRSDGTWDQKLAARFINQYFREGELSPDIEEDD